MLSGVMVVIETMMMVLLLLLLLFVAFGSLVCGDLKPCEKLLRLAQSATADSKKRSLALLMRSRGKRGRQWSRWCSCEEKLELRKLSELIVVQIRDVISGIL